MSFEVSATAYGRFMGRFSEPLAGELLARVTPRRGQCALDVGCGPGALTRPLAALLGVEAVTAVDPSEPFVAALRAKVPGIDVRRATAEELPFDDDTFDLVLAQLVVHFMRDPVAGLREMARVARPGGVLAASVWDHADRRGPLATFAEVVLALDPDAPLEPGMPGTRQGDLGKLAARAGWVGVEETALTVELHCPSFEDWWAPFLLGVGPAGDYVGKLDSGSRERLRSLLSERLGPGPITVPATAWCVLGAGPA